jgi:hypothetical protein
MGKWRIKKGLYFPIAMETRELLAHLHDLGWQINLRCIPRGQNEECDALSHRDPSGRSKGAGRLRNYTSGQNKAPPKEHQVQVLETTSVDHPARTLMELGHEAMEDSHC